jgi:hypothetical protein
VVRRLAFEAADTGLLGPELAAGIARLKRAKRIGVRLGNWLTTEQSRTLLPAPVIADLIGKAAHIRTVPVLGLGQSSRRSLVDVISGLPAGHLDQLPDATVRVDTGPCGACLRPRARSPSP